MKNKNGFVLSTYVYMLLVFFLLLLGTMLVVLNNTKLLSNKLKEGTQQSSGLIDKDFSFVLLGDKEVITRVGEEYTDKGFEVKTVKGVDLSEYVITKNDVDTDTIGDYEISYKVTYNGVTKELTRIVHVVDNIGVSYLNTLYQYRKDENGLIIDDTDDENLRYAGSNDDVKNYVEFGNTGELWRIVGVFDVASEEGGAPAPRIKLVRDESIGAFSWDSSASDINEGKGINQWGASTYDDGTTAYEGADLMRELNTLYLNKGSGYCCNAAGQAECSSSSGATSCNFTTTGINSTYREMIDDVLWNVSAAESTDPISIHNLYKDERDANVGDECSGKSGCTDEVKRTNFWKGKIALIYNTDFGYASSNITCRNNLRDKVNLSCKKDNWLSKNQNDAPHTIVAIDNNWDAYYIWYVYGAGRLSHSAASSASVVYPSLYLEENVKIISGTGTQIDPYKLSL